MSRSMSTQQVAIVGSDSLLGRELEDVFSNQAPHIQVVPLGSEVSESILTERDGEPAVIHPLDPRALESAQVVILCGSRESSRQAYMRIGQLDSPPVVVDLTFALEDRPEAVLLAPSASPGTPAGDATSVHVVAHAAAAVLAAFLGQLHLDHPIQRSVVQIFEPASERGQAGVDELQQQTVQLLSFHSLPKEVFGEQLAFNLLTSYGPEAEESLDQIESRIEKHLATLLDRAGSVPMPSLRLIQAPVFHGHCFSVWVEFQEAPKPRELSRLATEQDSSPSNVSIAQKGGFSVGRVEVDHNNPRAAWFWIAADNHRVTADSTVHLVRLLCTSEGHA